jgi:hypothetical protein
MRPAAQLAAAWLSLWPAAVRADSTGDAQQGFAELRLSLYPGASGDGFQLVERVRPSLTAELSERVKLVTTIEAGLRQGRDLTREFQRALEHSELGPLLQAAQCRWPSYQNSLLRIDGAADYLYVDRLFLDVYAGAIDVRLGRQALNWGSAQFFNPTDPFPEVLLAEPWRARRGVNAVRAVVPFGDSHDVTAVVATSDALDELRAAAKLRLNWAGTDFGLVSVYRGAHRNGLVGVDIRGTLEVGYWLEAAYLVGESPHEELAVGIDYSFPILERATAFIQYYRNGAGATDPSGYQRSAALGAIAPPTCAGSSLPLGAANTQRDPFAPFVLGRDYLVAGSSVLFLPELSATLAWLQNLNDGTGLLVPTVSYNLLDWLDLALSAQIPYAVDRGGELKPSRRDLRLQVAAPSGETLTADLSGLVPDTTLTVWSRASF